MKKILFLMMIAAATMVFAGCENSEDKQSGDKQPEDNPASPSLLVTPTTISAPADFGSYIFAVTCNRVWSATVSAGATWCTVWPIVSNGDDSGMINVAKNQTTAQRAATVTFTTDTLSQTIAVTQEEAVPFISTTWYRPINTAHSGGSYTIAVTSNTSWTTTVDAGVTWCTVSPAFCSGNCTVTVNVMENSTTVTRAATVTFSIGTLQVAGVINQAALPMVYSADDAPPYAASNRVWAFGPQTWSDVIEIPECNKQSYNQNTCTASCRRWGSIKNAYLYNENYVYTNAQTLCPAPWRVPTEEDANYLEHNYPGPYLLQQWGPSPYTGAFGLGERADIGAIYCESHACYDDWYELMYYSESGSNASTICCQHILAAVRCVK